MTPVAVILAVAIVALVVAMVLATYRLIKGPTALDRAVSIDVFSASIVGVVAILIIFQNRYDLAALMIVFALTAFFSTVTVSRFTGVGVSRRPGHRIVPPQARGDADEPELVGDPDAAQIVGQDEAAQTTGDVGGADPSQSEGTA